MPTDCLIKLDWAQLLVLITSYTRALLMLRGMYEILTYIEIEM
jgi:hypothetical protein